MRFTIALLSLAVLAAGCNKKTVTVSTVPVTGKITIGGKPLVGASVVFTNKNPDGPAASGTTDSQGEFKLSTWISPKEMHSGAVTGEYTAVITKAPPSESQPDDSSKMEHMTPAEREKFMATAMRKAADAQKGPKPKSEVPEKYSQRDSSPLQPTIAMGSDNRFDWALEE